MPFLYLLAVLLYLLSEGKISKPESWVLRITLSSCDIGDLIFTSSKKRVDAICSFLAPAEPVRQMKTPSRHRRNHGTI